MVTGDIASAARAELKAAGDSTPATASSTPVSERPASHEAAGPRMQMPPLSSWSVWKQTQAVKWGFGENQNKTKLR